MKVQIGTALWAGFGKSRVTPLLFLVMSSISAVQLGLIALAIPIGYLWLSTVLGTIFWLLIGLLVLPLTILPARSRGQLLDWLDAHGPAQSSILVAIAVALAVLLVATPGLWLSIGYHGLVGGTDPSLKKVVLYGTAGGFTVACLIFGVGLLGWVRDKLQ